MKLKSEQIQMHGSPLNEAWFDFARDELKDQYIQPKPNIGFNPANSFWSHLGDLCSDLSNQNNWELKKTNLMKELRNDLIEWLQEKYLFAYGFQIYPTSVRQYRPVPPDYWDNSNLQIDWGSNCTFDGDRKYHKILIVDPLDIPEIELDGSKRKKGEGDKINWAISELDKEIPYFKTRFKNKEKVQLIRDKIKSKYPDLDVYGNNFHDDTIRKKVNLFYKKFY